LKLFYFWFSSIKYGCDIAPILQKFVCSKSGPETEISSLLPVPGDDARSGKSFERKTDKANVNTPFYHVARDSALVAAGVALPWQP